MKRKIFSSPIFPAFLFVFLFIAILFTIIISGTKPEKKKIQPFTQKTSLEKKN